MIETLLHHSRPAIGLVCLRLLMSLLAPAQTVRQSDRIQEAAQVATGMFTPYRERDNQGVLRLYFYRLVSSLHSDPAHEDVRTKAGLEVLSTILIPPGKFIVLKYEIADTNFPLRVKPQGVTRADQLTGRATFGGVAPGTYFLVVNARYGNRTLVWNLRLDLKPGHEFGYARSTKCDGANDDHFFVFFGARRWVLISRSVGRRYEALS